MPRKTYRRKPASRKRKVARRGRRRLTGAGAIGNAVAAAAAAVNAANAIAGAIPRRTGSIPHGRSVGTNTDGRRTGVASGAAAHTRYRRQHPMTMGGHQQHEYLAPVTLGKPITGADAMMRLFKHGITSVNTRLSGVAPLASQYGSFYKLNSQFGMDNTADRFMPLFMFDLTAKPNQTTAPAVYRGAVKATTSSFEWQSTSISTSPGANFNPTCSQDTVGGLYEPGGFYIARHNFNNSTSSGFPTVVYWMDSTIRLVLRGAKKRTTEFFIAVQYYTDEEMFPESSNTDGRTAHWLNVMKKVHYSPLTYNPRPLDANIGKKVHTIMYKKVIVNPDDTGNADTNGLQKIIKIKLHPQSILEYKIGESRPYLSSLGKAAIDLQDSNDLPLNVPNDPKKRLFLNIWSNQPFDKTMRDGTAVGNTWADTDPADDDTYSPDYDGSFDLSISQTYVGHSTLT